MPKNPLLIGKAKAPHMSKPENQSKGILEDFAVRKVIQSREGIINKLLIGDINTPKDAAGDVDTKFRIVVEGAGISQIFERYIDAADSPGLFSRKARGTLISPTLPIDNDGLFYWAAQGWNGTNWIDGGIIIGEINGTPSATSMPMDWVFKTTPSGSTTSLERLRIKADGTISGSSFFASGNIDAANITHLSGAFVNLSGAYNTHVADASNPHGTILTQTNISSSGYISGASMEITGDHTISGCAYVANALYGTDAAAPTASNYPIGTIYFQYTP